MAKIVVEHVGADAKMFGRLGGTDQCWHRRHYVCEMIGGGQRAVAEILDLARLLHPFGARLRVMNVYSEPKRLHFSTTPVFCRDGRSHLRRLFGLRPGPRLMRRALAAPASSSSMRKTRRPPIPSAWTRRTSTSAPSR